MKKFTCGICKNKGRKEAVFTRRGLREHLRREHMIIKGLTNSPIKKIKQAWWKDEEVDLYGEK